MVVVAGKISLAAMTHDPHLARMWGDLSFEDVRQASLQLAGFPCVRMPLGVATLLVRFSFLSLSNRDMALN